jgi:Asp-tRNA(Asn)/Glu-tRNA(Gln) amidotransferase A subunit family amidase
MFASRFTRRRFLSSAVLVAGAAGLHSASSETPPSGVPCITARTIAEAEKLFSVQYRPEQRETIVATMAEQLAWVKARRKVNLSTELVPAMVFCPLLPAAALGPRHERLVHTTKARDVPQEDVDIAFASVAELSNWIEQRQLSSTRLTGIYLERLKRLGKKVNCTITLTEELALRQAAEADREIAQGCYLGALHGIPYGLKDLLDTAGIPTTYGAEPYRRRVPEKDAAVVVRLREAGAVLIAKLSLGALALNDVWFGGLTRNPWLLAEGSSGSSAGSAAAVGAGLVGFALGSETLGSIVSPSMRCGTTGLRPTFGRVPRSGAMVLSWSLDKLGPMTRTVEDAALVLRAIHGADRGDPASVTVPLDVDFAKSVKGLRVGYDPVWFEDKNAIPADRDALKAVQRIGVELVKIELPDLPREGLFPILYAESAASFEDLTLSHRDDELKMQVPDAWPNLWRRSRFISAVDIVQADRLRRKFMQVMDQLFTKVDAMVSPSLAGPMLTVTNYTGHPSLTLRTGFITINKLRNDFATDKPTPVSPPTRVPHGITFYGRLYDEGTILGLGSALEKSLNVWRERPPGF